MPETTNKTAMMQLRDRLQAITISTTHKGRRELAQTIINSIETELLAVEKQTIVDAYNLGRDCNVRATVDAGLHYFETTFNPK